MTGVGDDGPGVFRRIRGTGACTIARIEAANVASAMPTGAFAREAAVRAPAVGRFARRGAFWNDAPAGFAIGAGAA